MDTTRRLLILLCTALICAAALGPVVS